MLFTTATFAFLYLPIVLIGYYALGRRSGTWAAAWLFVASVFFYGYWMPEFTLLLLASIGTNFALGMRIAQAPSRGPAARWWLTIAIAFNLGLLGYFKYANFFVDNLNAALGTQWRLGEVLLPIGISFYTFTQIAYLVDTWAGKVNEARPVHYGLFVTYFPHLVAGPVLHHAQMMPQFADASVYRFDGARFWGGLAIFAIGLFKKVVLADGIAPYADAVFKPVDGGAFVGQQEAWIGALAYTFQLYFDFSGYCDMAMGVALLFNIWLPVNFNSPYRATSIQDFWRRWHITLSHFLRDHLYIPLGGNRAGRWRTHLNLVITFALGGLWHGASWMFVIWGLLHGLALVVHRLWGGLGWRMPRALAWGLTFLFVNVAWVFFRARDWDSARRVLAGMVDFSSLRTVPLADVPTEALAWSGWLGDALLRAMPAQLVAHLPALLMIALAFCIVPRPNAIHWATTGVTDAKVVAGTLVLVAALVATLASTSSVFLYFNF